MGTAGSDWKRLEVDETASSRDHATPVKGDFSPTARKLPLSDPAIFDKPAPKAQTRLTMDGKPFALEYKVGTGRLIAIADGRFMQNSQLDEDDARVLVVDLARA